jgi:hypothetical protein
LEPPQKREPQEIADVQAIRRRIETDIGTAATAAEVMGKLIPRRGVDEERPGHEIVEKRLWRQAHVRIIAFRNRAGNARALSIMAAGWLRRSERPGVPPLLRRREGGCALF